MRYLPLIAACACLASPAMAGGTTFIEKTTPPTELETCTIKLRTTSDLLQQLIRKVSAPPLAAPDLSRRSEAKAEAKPRKTKGCKKGRTRNARGICGVWS